LNKNQQEAIFKYLIVQEVRRIISKDRSKYIKAIAEKKFFNPKTQNYVTFGESTIYRYITILEKYLENISRENEETKDSKMDKKEPYCCFERKTRKDKGISKAIPDFILDFAVNLRRDTPTRTTATLIGIIKDEYGCELKRSTLNYHLSRLGYSRLHMRVVDSKIHIRFESEHINDLWIGDYHDASYLLMNGQNVHLSAFIDCKSRFIVHAQYYIRENLLTLEDSFKKATLKSGCPKLVYVDNAKIYHADRFIYCCLKLGIEAPIYSKPYVKESRGKIEKFFSYVKTNFEKEAIARGGFESIDALNEYFQAFLELNYHKKVHSETNRKPLEEFSEKENEMYKRYPDIVVLNELFMIVEERMVHKKMKTVSVMNILFVTDSFLGGKKVEVHFNPNDLSYVLIYQNDAFIMKAFPQELNAKPNKPIEHYDPDFNFRYDYLSALKGKYDRLLKENASLTDYSTIKTDYSGTFNFNKFVQLFSELLEKELTARDIDILKIFYDQYRIDDGRVVIDSLNYSIRNHGKSKFLQFYLDLLLVSVFQKRSDK